jgi:hypothetical protein
LPRRPRQEDGDSAEQCEMRWGNFLHLLLVPFFAWFVCFVGKRG